MMEEIGMEEMKRPPSAELAEEATEESVVENAARPLDAASTASVSSSEESWTILNEEDAISVDSRASRDEDEPMQGPKEEPAASAPQQQASCTESELQYKADSDSDIETLERCGERASSVAGLLASLTGFAQAQQIPQGDGTESLTSDGIPIEDEYQDDGEGGAERYQWNADIPKNDEEEEEDERSSECEVSEEEDDDLEMLPPLSPAPGALAARDMANDVSSGYPNDELPEEFAEAKFPRGRGYSHERNQYINYWLTTVVVLALAIVLGLGVGHFLGWSERLELQEYYSEVREEKMEELTDSLVDCMTGAEGAGGDDQDLDDRVIHQLRLENRDLKEELEVLRGEGEASDQIREELEQQNEVTAILRDRVNDLLTANADLEKEVARLRYAHGALQTAEKQKEELEEAMRSLNAAANENDQLKMAVAKARYTSPPVPVSEKAKINELRNENDELKKEIRRARYAPSAATSETTTEASELFSEEEASRPMVPHYVLAHGDQTALNEAEKESSSNASNVEVDEASVESDEGIVPDQPDSTPVDSGLVTLLGDADWAPESSTAAPLQPETFFAQPAIGGEEEEIRWMDDPEWQPVQTEDVEEALETPLGTSQWRPSAKVVSEEDEELLRPFDALGGFVEELPSLSTLYDDEGFVEEVEEEPIPGFFEEETVGPDWLSERAEHRQKHRDESKRADWMFERARDREGFHDLRSSDWQTRRVHRRRCTTGADGHVECVDLEDLNEAGINHGSGPKKNKTKAKKGDDGDEEFFVFGEFGADSSGSGTFDSEPGSFGKNVNGQRKPHQDYNLRSKFSAGTSRRAHTFDSDEDDDDDDDYNEWSWVRAPHGRRHWDSDEDDDDDDDDEDWEPFKFSAPRFHQNVHNDFHRHGQAHHNRQKHFNKRQKHHHHHHHGHRRHHQHRHHGSKRGDHIAAEMRRFRMNNFR